MNIVLVEGRNLMSKDDNEISDAYVKFRLGNEKYKSKVIDLKCFYTNLIFQIQIEYPKIIESYLV